MNGSLSIRCTFYFGGLTGSPARASTFGMGRKPQFDTSIRLLLTKATLARIEAAARAAGENRFALIRAAVEKELARREADPKVPGQAKGDGVGELG